MLFSKPSRTRRALPWLALAAIWVAVLVAWTGPAPADERSPRDAIARLISSLRLEKPRSHHALTLVPLAVHGDVATAVRSLSEGLKDGTVRVTEIGEGSVNELSVENTGKQPVFIMAGQILVGARQNRVLQNDLLLPPNSGRIAVGAFCVQHGRWQYSGKDKAFHKSDNVSNLSVRQVARERKEQGQVWTAVAGTQRAVGAANESSDLDQVYATEKVKDESRGYLEAFEDLPTRLPEMHGVAVLVRGHLLAVDLFGSRRLLRSLWSPLLASYVLEAVSPGVTRDGDPLDLAQGILDRAARSEATRQATPGAGVLVELKATGLSGSALLAASQVLHLEAFPSRGATTRTAPPVPNEPPIQRHY